MHQELHRSERIGWLRAAVLGANDGLISTSSLVVGVAAAEPGAWRSCWLRSRAGGRRPFYGSRRVRLGQLPSGHRACRSRPGAWRTRELAGGRAGRVGGALHRTGTKPCACDPGCRSTDGTRCPGSPCPGRARIHETTRARPIQAAVASATSFAVGAAPPAVLAALLPAGSLTPGVAGVTLGLLLVLGGVAARLGGAPLARGALRVAFWVRWPWGVLPQSDVSSVRSSRSTIQKGNTE